MPLALALLSLKSGVPIDFSDDAEYTALMRAMDCQDCKMAQWLVSLRLKELMQERGAVFPPCTPEEIRVNREVK